MEDEQLYICIFPYFKISEPIRIREETLYPSSAIDESKVPEEIKKHLNRLRNLFYDFTNKLIPDFTWLFLIKPTNRRYSEFKRHLEEIQRILGYLCCIPDERPQHFWLHTYYEQFDYYLFQPSTLVYHDSIYAVRFVDVNEDENYYNPVEGYEYFINQDGIWKITDGYRIYPSTRLNQLAYDLGSVLKQIEWQPLVNITSLFDENFIGVSQERRIFKAMEWYNRSCRYTSSPDLQLIFLAVAFEALLGTYHDKKSSFDWVSDFDKQRDKKTDFSGVSQKLQDSIRLLVGDIARLDEWSKQFYDSRSNIVHEGDWSNLHLSPKAKLGNQTESKTEYSGYGFLVHYGWLVFRICMNAILMGRIKAAQINMKAKFFHHQERLEHILEILSLSKDSHEALLAIMEDIRALYEYPMEDTYLIKLDTAWAVVKKLSEKLLDLEINLTEEQEKTLKEIVLDKNPHNSVNAEKIIDHINLVLREAVVTVPSEKIQKLASAVTLQPVSITEVRQYVKDLLKDKGDTQLTDPHLHRIQQINTLLEYSFYGEKLRIVLRLTTNSGGDIIHQHNLFSLIDGYSRFIEHVIEKTELDTQIYIHRVNELLSK